MSDLVGNPKDQSSHNEAHIIFEGLPHVHYAIWIFIIAVILSIFVFEVLIVTVPGHCYLFRY